MSKKLQLRLYFALLLTVLGTLLGYKIYLLLFETDYEAVNAQQIEQLEHRTKADGALRFAVVGNLNNAMRIYEQRLAPAMKAQHTDFILFAGNAVYDGSESKYRLLYRGLSNANLPFVLAPGDNYDRKPDGSMV